MFPTARLRTIWEIVSDSLWFIPVLMAVVAVGFAIGLVELDARIGSIPEGARFLFRVNVDGARSIVSAIAGSTITVVGTIFSITMVVLALASNQYTSRVLRNFTSDRANQIVLGIFIGTFTYSLLVLRTIGTGGFVPVISVTFGILLALSSMGALIYFIGHTAHSIQASQIVARAADRTTPLIDSLFPDDAGEPAAGAALPTGASEMVRAPRAGYVQLLDGGGVMKCASENDIVVRMERPIGDFVAKGASLASIFPAGRANEKLCREVESFFAIGEIRTVQQDVHFGFSQISDIAVKALSPGINDPTTALICIDHLGALLMRMAERDDPVPLRADSSGKLRLVAKCSDFDALLLDAFGQIRRYGKGDVEVVLRLLAVLTELAGVVKGEGRRGAIQREGAAIADDTREAVVAAADRERVDEALARLGEALAKR
ncbi:MAG TPA: DUF2254 domain-containing protein [Gemmatimonadaceae bacterium]|jgi:uncharacterized membrane protein|nr:DUF2254 domain-containing protein [Gemmatimonadaceae bacterium]